MTEDETFEALRRTKLERLVKEFFKILDKEEISDNGLKFHPTYITSCRTIDLMNMNIILDKMKELVK